MDLTTKNGRKAAIKMIESHTNKGRKTESYQASEIYQDRIKEYVVETLREQFSETTVREMPIVSSVNICKRIVDQLACIYSDQPTREFTELSDDQIEVMNDIYDDMGANNKLALANRLYKNHDHCLIQVVPKMGKMIMRVLKPHQWDAIPNELDPEVAKAIIISSYDNYNELSEAADQVAPATGVSSLASQAKNDYEEQLALNKSTSSGDKLYYVYTLDEMYTMTKGGDIVGEVMPNPLRDFELLPFVEVSNEKEFEYWVRPHNSYAQFTRDFNSSMSQVQQVVKMQGFAVGVLKGPQELLMETVTVGPNIILKLPNDVNAGVETDFQYITPGSDIAGSIQYLEVLLTTFLSSNGINPKTVSMDGTAQTYSSGIERLLAMIEKVSASRADFDLFEKTESKIYALIKAWLSVLDNAINLDDKYKIRGLPEDSQIKVTYAKPELVKSDSEELDVIEREVALGISSPIAAIMEREKLSREQAEERFDLYAEDMMRMTPTQPPVMDIDNGDQE